MIQHAVVCGPIRLRKRIRDQSLVGPKMTKVNIAAFTTTLSGEFNVFCSSYSQGCMQTSHIAT